MKYIVLILLLSACTSSYKRTGIIHNYIFKNAEVICQNHNGVHYIVQVTDIKEIGLEKDYPCTEQTKIRCEDGTLHNFNTGANWCFVSEGQLNDTLTNKDVSEEYK